MKLNQKSAAALELPDGKTDYIFWCDELPGFGLRLRAGEGKVRRSWVAQYRFHGRTPRMTIARFEKLSVRQKQELLEAIKAHIRGGRPIIWR